MKESYLFFAGIIAVAVLLFVFYIPVITRYHNLKLQEDEMDIKIRELDQKIKTLVEERNLLKNDRDYLEKVIRKELGLVKPGEIVYKFITEPRKKEEMPKADSSAAEEAAGIQGTRQPAVPASVASGTKAPTTSAPKLKLADKVENPTSKPVHDLR